MIPGPGGHPWSWHWRIIRRSPVCMLLFGWIIVQLIVMVVKGFTQ